MRTVMNFFSPLNFVLSPLSELLIPSLWSIILRFLTFSFFLSFFFLSPLLRLTLFTVHWWITPCQLLFALRSNYSPHFCVCNQVRHCKCLPGDAVWKCAPLSGYFKNHRTSPLSMMAGFWAIIWPFGTDSTLPKIQWIWFTEWHLVGLQISTKWIPLITSSPRVAAINTKCLS